MSAETGFPAPAAPVPMAPDIAAMLAAAQVRRRRGLRRASLSAVLAALSGVALLGFSGWFLAGAALAGAAGGAALQSFNYLIPSAAIRLAAIARTGGRYLERLLAHEAALGALAELRVSLFSRLAAKDPRTLPGLSTGEGTARLTSDVDTLEDQIIRTPSRPAAVAGAAMAVGLAAFSGPFAAAGLALALAGLVPLAGWLSARCVDAAATEATTRASAIKAAVADQLAASAEIAVYGLSDRVAAALGEQAARMDAARRRMARGEALVAGLLTAAGPILAAAMLVLAQLWGASAPRAALAALAAAAAAETLGGWVRARTRTAAMAAASARLAALGADAPAPPPTTAAPSAAAPSAAAPAIAPTDLSLDIAGHRLAPGARLALTGVSGSGKTRLLETLAGWRADAPQPLALGGIAVAALGFEVLAQNFALAPQAPRLIAGSVADNLRLAAPGLSEAALWEALEVACLADDIRALPHGLLTDLGEGAGQFSGGQRKRLALARALLAGRPWLLLDEPSEGLDPATEAALTQRLDTWLAQTGTGLILTSHRPAPLALAPRQLALAP
jgi:ATP-binding cassette subfamily C protein CydC